MKQLWSFLLTALLLMFYTEVVHSTCYSEESCLYDALMTNYNNQVRPATGPSGTVQVHLTVSLFTILDLDEKNEVLKTVISISAEWTDYFLSWNSTTYTIPEILVSVTNLWLPDFAITNSVESFYKATFLEDFRAHIIHTGVVIWKFGGIFKTSCSLDISKYPFDTQTCTLKIENWAYRESLVNLTGANLITSTLEDNSLWAVTSTSVSRETYIDEGMNYPRITITLNFKRKFNYYIFNIILPCLLVTVAAMGVFWLPPDCGEKISLGITVLLAFSVFQIVIMDNTPVNSETTPFISELVMTIMAMATVSVVSAMLSTSVHFKGPTNRVPKLMRVFAFKGIARVLCLRRQVDAIESVLDVGGNNITPLFEPVIELEQLNSVKPKPLSEMGAILKQLTAINDSLNEKKADDAVMDEWKLLAKIIDRLFFWISLCVLVIVIIVIVPK